MPTFQKLILFLIVPLVFVLSYGCYYVVSHDTFFGLCLDTMEERGQFGDLFGAVNALFSGLALAGLIITLAYQQIQFRAQRTESVFFGLLQIHIENARTIDIQTNSDKKVLYRGKDSFYYFHKTLKATVQEARLNMGLESPIDDKIARLKQKKPFVVPTGTTVSLYEKKIFTKHHQDLSHYYRNLYHLVRYVDESGANEKKQYMRIVRSTLSSYELIILFYNCLSTHGRGNFKPLIERTGLLHNIQYDLLFETQDKAQYKASAYKAI